MKKIIALFLMILMFGAALPVLAGPDDEKRAKYEEMKAIKEKQRAEREARKKEEAANPNAPHEKTFWEKEGERSGLGGSGNRFGQFMKNLNPVPFFKDQDEKYKARKAAAYTT